MHQCLRVYPIKTKVFHLGQDLEKFLIQSLKEFAVSEGCILVITSKIISLAESRTVPKSQIDKKDLVIQEADHDLGEVGFGCRLTIKHGLFIPSAGIDESNSENEDFILFPKDPFSSAALIHRTLSAHFGLKNLGILITDSHTLPLRQGVTGIALSYWGFEGVKNKIGQTDLFGRRLQMTKMDLADGLAAAAVMMMGEGDECCPLAMIENAPVTFQPKTDPQELQMRVQDDLYYPLYRDRLNADLNSK